MTFNDLLETGRRLLIVSLPENSIDYAKAAMDAGADAVKLHVNVTHRATQTEHASWATLRDKVKQIYSELGCCMGMVPGTTTMANEHEINEMIDCGISLFDAYADFAPLYLLKARATVMIALNHTSSLNMAKELAAIGADCVEVSIVSPEHYREPLTVTDLIHYRQILGETTLPAFVPTEKHILPDEIAPLFDLGFRGLIIGPVVTGVDMDTFGGVIRTYSKVIHHYNEKQGRH